MEWTDALTQLHDGLLKTSEALNLFSSSDRDKLGSKHFPDALAIQPHWTPGARVLDLGSGGGIPGLVLAAVYPETSFCLMDARQKKMQALEALAQELDFKHVSFVAGRFEELGHDPAYREQFDTVLARAVAPLSTLLEYAAPFISVGGTFYAWKGPRWEEELAAAKSALKELQLEHQASHSYTLPDGEERCILVFQKQTATPEKFPRRTGIPLKRPL